MSTAAHLPEHVTISPDVLYQTVEGQAVLLDLRDERYYSLDDVGSNIWKLLTEHHDVHVISERMLGLYEVDASKLREDLATFLSKLADAGLVRVTPEFPASS